MSTLWLSREPHASSSCYSRSNVISASYLLDLHRWKIPKLHGAALPTPDDVPSPLTIDSLHADPRCHAISFIDPGSTVSSGYRHDCRRNILSTSSQSSVDSSAVGVVTGFFRVRADAPFSYGTAYSVVRLIISARTSLVQLRTQAESPSE